MNRRRFLAATASATAATVGTAGCLGALAGADTVTDGDTVTVDGVDFELGGLRLQSTFVEQGDPFWRWNAVANPDGQYATVLLSPRTDDETRARQALRNASVAAHVDGEVAADDHLLNEEDYAGIQLGVPLPDNRTFDDAALVFETLSPARYELSERHLDELANPPRYTVDVRIPDTFDGNRIPVELGVTNTGDNLGTIAWTTTHSRVEDGWYTNDVTVGAGDTERTEHVHARLDADPGDTVGVTADWGLDEHHRELPVETDGATPNNRCRFTAFRPSFTTFSRG